MLLQANNSGALPITAATRQSLERALASLRAERREIPARLRSARQFGDTSNNDEHLAIREEEAVLAARIARLEDILVRTTEVDHSAVDDSVTIGSTVTVADVGTGETHDYAIGGAHAVSPGTVSAVSPIGRALIGRRVGDQASVKLPRGRRRELRITEIGHPREP